MKINIIEFIEHYLNLGFDKIIIADNNDEPTILELLDDYIKKWYKLKFMTFRGVNYFQVHYADLLIRKL